MSVLNIANINSPTVPLSVTSTSASVALPQKGPFVVVTNLGTAPAWCATGTTAPTAVVSTGNNMCVLPQGVMTFRISPTDAYLAAVSTGTTTLSISVTNGQ